MSTINNVAETLVTYDPESPMKYLCLIYYEETALAGLSQDDYAALVDESLIYSSQLRESGHFVAAHALQSPQAATTLRISKGKLSITDGPFAETKEQLGGFILIDAKDLNDAIRIAARIPPARLGCVELRPVRELRAP
jgi:hypothetical protein